MTQAKPKILLVDDDLDILTSVGILLRKSGYEVETREKVTDLESAVREVKPDLILLDVMFAGMLQDGFSACRALRAIPELKAIPLVMFTAINEYYPFAFSPDGHDLPADALIDKATPASTFLDKIAKLIKPAG